MSDPKVIVAFVSKYNFWNDVNVVPVVDVGADKFGVPCLGAERFEKLIDWPQGQSVTAQITDLK